MQWAIPEQDADKAFEGENPTRRKDLVWNILTILVLVGIVAQLIGFAVVYANPRMALNPFPPATLPAAIVLPTSTPTPKILPATWTPTAPATATPTITLTPIATIAATDAVEVEPGALAATDAATEAPASMYAFALKGDEVKLVDATLFRPEHGCKWMGVAGKATDLKDRPITGITVQVGGSLGRNYIDLISLTGTALWYGQSGYEVFLTDTPADTKGSLWVRLLDQSGLPLSPKIYFNTSKDCQKNLVVIDFQQVR